MKIRSLYFAVMIISLASASSSEALEEKFAITPNKVTGKTDNIEPVILGKWISEQSLKGATLVLIQSPDKKLIMRITFKNGSIKNENLAESIVNGKKRYDCNNIHGEYYLLEDNGNLGFYDRDGKFDEAIKIGMPEL